MEKISSVNEYLLRHNNWQQELDLLISTMRNLSMEEGMKWSIPTYMINKKNVISIAAFKAYVGLWFHQGSFLKDSSRVLVNAQEGKTKGMRQWRFQDVDEIKNNLHLIEEYAIEAIKNCEQGLEIKPEKKSAPTMPEELAKALDEGQGLREKFYLFSKFQQKEFITYISEAKKSETKKRRLNKIIPMILEGVGLNDKYR